MFAYDEMAMGGNAKSCYHRVFFCSGRIVLVIILVLCCQTVFASGFLQRQPSIIFTNSSPFKRINEIISIHRSQLHNRDSKLVPQIKKNGKLFITQTIDADGDGKWDQLLIEVSLAAHSSDTVQLNWIQKNDDFSFPKLTNVQLSLRSDTKTPSPEMATAIRFRGFTQNIAKPFYQMEGPGIENDNVAFRAFFDSRNSFDIYGKIVDTPVLEHVGVGASWHELQPWGMDIFHTGNSLGAGGLAVEEERKIYRLGDADTSTFKALYEGPLSAAFQLKFSGWDVAKAKQPGSEIISISKGTFYYKNEIELTLTKAQKLIAGIANFGVTNVMYKKHNDAFSSVSTYGAQAEGTNTKLGVAILFPSKDYRSTTTTDTLSVIPNTTYIVMKGTTKKTLYFFACWEKTDPRFATKKGFEEYLQASADALANPIKIKIIQR